MGDGRYTRSAFVSYAATSGIDTARSAGEIYKAKTLDPTLDIRNAKDIGGQKRIREARDNYDHPVTTPIIVGLDVSGSMDPVLTYMAKEGLDSIVTNLYNRLPVPDPAVLALAVDDVDVGNPVPFQVTQFEADIRIQEQLARIYFERGGGGNSFESYMLAHYFAARHTATDAWEQRQKRGYLFTIGDEQPQPVLYKNAIKSVFDDDIPDNISAAEIIKEASERWEIYHIMVEQGSHMMTSGDRVRKTWMALLGQRAISLPDIKNLGQVIVSAIQINEGEDYEAIAKSWEDAGDADAAKTVKRVFAKATDV